MNGEGKRRKFWVITPIISKVWPVANPDTGWKPNATLHRRVVAVGARNSRQEAFREIARSSGEQCSIGFQPV
jgi:hypothetical protein